MKKVLERMLAVLLIMPLAACGSGGKTTEAAVSNKEESVVETAEEQIPEEKEAEQEELTNYTVFGAEIHVPSGWKGAEDGNWYTLFSDTDSGTGVRIATLSTGSGGDCNAIISEVHNTLTNDTESGQPEKYEKGIKYRIKTKDKNEEFTVPTTVYLFPVQQDKLIFIAVAYNTEFDVYLKAADYSKAYASIEVEEETSSWEVGESFIRKITDSLGTKYIQVITPVVNTGTKNLYLDSGTIDLEDADGHLVDTLTMVSAYPQIIASGETGYYLVETFDETEGADVTALLHEKIKEATVPNTRYELSDISIKNGQFRGVEITGRVENTTNEDGKLVYIVAILYNSNNEPIGSAFTILTDTLSAGDKVGFSISTMVSPVNISAADVDHYDIYAYPQQFQF